MDLQALNCPNCNSPHVQRAADGTFRCRNCDTRLLLVDSLGQLVIPAVEGWLDCPNCGHLNSEEQLFCSRCGTPVRYQCAQCGTVRLADEPVCGVCGLTAAGAQDVVRAKSQRKRNRRRGIGAGCIALALMWSGWFFVINAFDCRTNSTADGIALVLCLGGPFLGLVVGGGVYSLLQASVPPLPGD